MLLALPACKLFRSQTKREQTRSCSYNWRTDPNGVSEGDGDGERQSFWNGDDEDRDGDDEEVYEVLDVSVAPWKLLDGDLSHDQLKNENDKR